MDNKKQKNIKPQNSASKKQLSDETRVIPKADSTNIKGENKGLFVPRTKPKNLYLGIAVKTFKMLILVLLILGIGSMGALFGVASAYVETSPIVDAAVLTDISKTSLIYDMHGNEIGRYNGTENRIWTKIDDMPTHLKDAFVSIEDTRFYSHEGIDYKRLLGAFLGNLQSSSVQGGSTISQQLVKLRMLTPERSYKRKIQEAYMTMSLEKEYNKDQILESYMNTILLGGSNYGVQVAAKDYFGKDVQDLTIREAAMLAGITQSPNKFNPRTNYYVNKTPNIVNDRTDLVLRAMYAAGRITEEQFNSAMEEQVQIKKEPVTVDKLNYAYFIEYAITDITDHLLIERKLENTNKNRDAIEKELRESGYKIHLTIDPAIQNTVQETMTNYKHYPKMKDPKDSTISETIGNDTIKIEQPQAAATVYDYHAGEFRAVIGGRNAPFAEKLWNRAAVSRGSVGSAIKPIAVYAPALDLGLTPNSTVSNATSKIDGWIGGSGYPKGGGPNGNVTIHDAVVQSMNRATARTLMENVGLDKSAEYLEKLGVNPSHINKNPSGLGLGTSPITAVEMSAAFGTLGNKGKYIQPFSFTKIEDSNGKVILDGKKIQGQSENQVFKEQTALQMTQILQDAVSSGTGSKAKLPNMTTAGKTGTNDDYKNITFVGYTPYYSGAVFIGHDNNKPLSSAYGGDFAAPLWREIMTKIHKDLPNKPIIEGVVDTSVKTVKICNATGLLATDACAHDILGNGVTEKSASASDVPTESCTDHVAYEICADSHMLAGPSCPNKVKVGLLSSRMDEYLAAARSRFPNFSINGVCSIHNATTQTNSTFTLPPTQTTTSSTELNDLKIQASSLLSKAKKLIDKGTDPPGLKAAYNELMSVYNNPNATAAQYKAKISKINQYL